MKALCAISFAIFLGSTAVVAQTINQYHPQKFDPQAAQALPQVQLEDWQASASVCPVAMQAKQGAGWSMVKAGHGHPRESGAFQSIRLTLSDGKQGPIVAARIKVRGLTDKPHVLATADGPAEMTRYVNVSFDGDAVNEAAADLTLHGFTSIKSIDLVSITYADGSTWNAGQHTCRAVPDPLMLVGAR